MKTVLEKVNEIDKLLHRMTKMESMMWAGKWLDAHRECCRLIAALQRAKQDIITFGTKEVSEVSPDEE